MLIALICLITRLLSRIAYNMLFSLQVKHYGLLRHFFTREEWRVVIGMLLCAFHAYTFRSGNVCIDSGCCLSIFLPDGLMNHQVWPC